IEFSGNVIFVSKDRRTPLVQYFTRDQSSFRIATLVAFAEDIFKRSYEQGRDMSVDPLVDMRYTSAAPRARLTYTRGAVVKYFLNYHSNAPEIYEMALQQSADTLWVLDSFGCLYSAKLEGNSASWSHHVLGGTRGSGEAPFVISICSLPDSTLGSDSIFM